MFFSEFLGYSDPNILLTKFFSINPNYNIESLAGKIKFCDSEIDLFQEGLAMLHIHNQERYADVKVGILAPLTYAQNDHN